MLKIILFDIDGVMIRLPKYFSSVLEENGYKDAANILNEYFNGSGNTLCLTAKADPIVSINPFLDRISWKHTPNDYFKQQYEYESGYVDHKLLQKITAARSNGMVCITATDQDALRSKFLLDDLNFRNIFDDNYISNEIGYLKKEEKYWDHVLGSIKLKYSNVKVNEILFCDDINSNIETASKTGINVMHVLKPDGITKLYDILDNCC
jgi:FMN phosphatase YigB (HAD superfamily)